MKKVMFTALWELADCSGSLDAVLSKESLCPKPKLGGGAKGEGLEIFGTTSRPEVWWLSSLLG